MFPGIIVYLQKISGDFFLLMSNEPLLAKATFKQRSYFIFGNTGTRSI